MIRSQVVAVACAAGLSLALCPAAAAGSENVTYEVVSSDVGAVDVEYFDGTARRLVTDVPLPWRLTVPLANPQSLGLDGAELRADWRRSIAAPVWIPGKWVSVRIYIGSTLRCQNTLDVGNAACYGSTSFKS